MAEVKEYHDILMTAVNSDDIVNVADINRDAFYGLSTMISDIALPGPADQYNTKLLYDAIISFRCPGVNIGRLKVVDNTYHLTAFYKLKCKDKVDGADYLEFDLAYECDKHMYPLSIYTKSNVK